jgi:urease accessory protein
MQHLIKVVFMLAIFVPTDGLAHPFYASDGGFVATFLHPFSGLDHLLAMLTVGIIGRVQYKPGCAMVLASQLPEYGCSGLLPGSIGWQYRTGGVDGCCIRGGAGPYAG